MRLCHVVLLAVLLPGPVVRGAETANGWRGNGTGLWPDAAPPLEWHRIPQGALEGLRASAHRPGNAEAGDAPLVEKGLLRDWLVLGPFPVADSTKDFDRDVLNGEANVEPSNGQQLAAKTWTPVAVPPDDIMVFGTAELPWLDVGKAVGFQLNQVAYAHCYLFSPRGGPARIVVDHGHGLKAWVNGKEVYRSPQRKIGLGYYTVLSRIELRQLDQESAKFDLTLKQGWNRLLLKLSSSNQAGWNDMRCSLRLSDAPNVAYDSKNILWLAPLPGRSTSTPILVGDRLFVMAEPDELVCLDRDSGRRLWTASVNYYEALTKEERAAQPAFATRIEPLRADLQRATDPRQRLRLRAAMQKALLETDEGRFKIAANDHFEGHFGIVGFTMPTPVSDGKHVYVWSGMGVAACFDLEGKRRWITRVQTDDLSYGSSPALADGVLAVFLNGLYGLDAQTGKQLWRQRLVRYNVAAIQAATLSGQAVFVTQRGDVVRPKDGELLLRQRDSGAPGDTGWAPPLLLGERMYLPKYGVASVTGFDFAGAVKWEPKQIARVELPADISKGPGGKWIDRWTAGSPLLWQDVVYQCDIYEILYAADVKTGKMLYRQPLNLGGFTHYNAVAVTASPTLIGKHLVVQGNQGTAAVLTPGRDFQLVRRNRIATQLDRAWPIPAQETLSYAPPIVAGNRLYLRGEAHLYCIGSK